MSHTEGYHGEELCFEETDAMLHNTTMVVKWGNGLESLSPQSSGRPESES